MTLSHLIPEMGKIRLCGGAEERTADGATGQQNIGLTFSESEDSWTDCSGNNLCKKEMDGVL